MGWVTLQDGQHLFIGPGGRVEPGGPGTAVSTRRRRKAGAIVEEARAQKARDIKHGLAHLAGNRHERAKVQAGIRTQRNAKRAIRHADTAAAEAALTKQNQATEAKAAELRARAQRAEATRTAAQTARTARASEPGRFVTDPARRSQQAEQLRTLRQAGAPRGVVAAIRAGRTTTRGVQIRSYGTPEQINRRSNLLVGARVRDTQARQAAQAVPAPARPAPAVAVPARPAPAAPPARGGLSMTPNAVRTREQRAQRAIRAVEAAREAKRTVIHRKVTFGGSQASVDQARSVLATAKQARDAAIRLKQAGRAAQAGAAAPAAAPAAARPAPRSTIPSTGGLIPKRTTKAFENATLGETQNARVNIRPDAHALAKKWFGPDTTPEHVASLTGAPDSARVTIHTYNDRIILSVDHPDIQSMDRTIRRDSDGQIRIHNDLFRTREGANRGFNGYYTWARFGYDAPLASHHTEQLRNATGAMAEHRDATRISDLMATQHGRAWWKDKGTWTQMSFDLDKGSKSMRTLDAYLKHRQEGGTLESGVGIKAFARQVENAHRMGVRSIDTSAARS